MYKIIDGKIYQTMDNVDSLKVNIEKLYRDVQGYNTALQNCETQIKTFTHQKETYQNQIDQLIANSGIDAELVKLIAPDKASVLGF